MKADNDTGRAYLAIVISLIAVCSVLGIIGATIAYLEKKSEEPRVPPKPATLGTSAESGFMRATGERGQVLENFQDGIGYWCTPGAAEVFTEQAVKRLLEGFKEKYHATREVITEKIFPSPEGRQTAAYCIFYELKKKAPPRRPGKALASAGVFYCSINACVLLEAAVTRYSLVQYKNMHIVGRNYKKESVEQRVTETCF